MLRSDPVSATVVQRLRSAFMAACLVLACGCLTIEENYVFKKDGSGTMEYVVDLSEMGELMKGLPGADDKDDSKGMMDMKGDLGKIKALPGISKVKLKTEKDGYLQRLSFRFADLAALNSALGQLMPDSTGVATEFFRMEGNTLVRTNNKHASELGGSMGGEAGDSTDMTMFLQSMHYRYDFKFAQDVGAAHVAEGVTTEQPSGKEVKMSTDWSVISKDPKALDLRIDLAPR